MCNGLSLEDVKSARVPLGKVDNVDAVDGNNSCKLFSEGCDILDMNDMRPTPGQKHPHSAEIPEI